MNISEVERKIEERRQAMAEFKSQYIAASGQTTASPDGDVSGFGATEFSESADEELGGYESDEILEIGSESGEESVLSFCQNGEVSAVPAPIFTPMRQQSQPQPQPQQVKVPHAPRQARPPVETAILEGEMIQHPVLEKIIQKSQVSEEVLAAHNEAFPLDAQGEDFDRMWAAIAGRAAIMWVAPKFPGIASIWRQRLLAVFVRPLVDVERRTVKGVCAIPLSGRMHRTTVQLTRHKRRVVYARPPQISPDLWPEMAREVYYQTIDAVTRMRATADQSLPQYPVFPSVYSLLPEPNFDPHWAAVNKGGNTALLQQKHLRIYKKGAQTQYLVPYRWTSGGSPVFLHSAPATIIELGTGRVGGLEAADGYNVKIQVTL